MRVMNLQKLLGWLGLIFLTGCDCMQLARGVVIDASTNQPIDSVIVSVVYRDQLYKQHFTDTSGRFQFSYLSGGIFGCPPIRLQLEKSGYEIKRVKCKSHRSKTFTLQ